MTQRDEGHHNGEITSEKLEYFLGSDHTNKQELLDEIISLLNKKVDIDDYVQDVSDHWNYSKREEEI
ncbi:hypothetical protein OAP46_00390 [bacterium]|nr:hypothetical protein [bacterium]|tara:strand:+ start:243 stop:443 length:201 start_codon:yes stop_codon:yes gene_type:complete